MLISIVPEDYELNLCVVSFTFYWTTSISLFITFVVIN